MMRYDSSFCNGSIPPMRSTLQTRFAVLVPLLAVCVGLGDASIAPAVAERQSVKQQGQAEDSSVDTDRVGYLVQISLPIDSKVSASVRRTLKQISEKPQLAVRREDRPIVVLEFDTDHGKTGRGSELEACMSLALYLGDPDLNQLQTVAYIPANRNFIESENTAADGRQFTGQLNGHAVLVAIAANQIAIGPNTAIGNAGIDDGKVRPLFREVYRSVSTERGTTFPVPVVMAMLDKQAQLYRVSFNDGSVRYANHEEWRKLESSGRTTGSETIANRDEFALLTGQQLADFGLVRFTRRQSGRRR
jgi:hypothetical protein